MDTKAERGSIAQIILNALAQGDKYGYEIIKDIETASGGKLILKQPSLYSSLRRMEEQGLISSYWGDSSIGGRRHYYNMTEQGKNQYEKNKNNWVDYDALMLSLNSHVNKAENTEKTSGGIKILKQENLFNLNKTDIPKRVEDAQNEDSSFVQFDMFNENASFVATNQKEQAAPNLYDSKIAASAHKGTIEPCSPIIKNYNSIDIADLENVKTNYKTFSNSMQEEKSDFAFKKDLEPAFNDDLQDEQEEIVEGSLSAFDEEDEQKELNTSIQTPEPDSPADLSKFNEVLKDDERLAIKSKERHVVSITSIKEEKEYIDYKNVLGNLYVNANAGDPYTKKRFNEREYAKKVEQEQENTYDALNTSSEADTPYISLNEPELVESNAAASDSESPNGIISFEVLKNKLSIDGIKLKKFERKQNIVKTSGGFVNYAKLKFVQGWIVWFIMIIEILVTFLVVQYNNALTGGQDVVYYIALGLSFIYPLVYSVYYSSNPQRKVESNFKVNIGLLNKFLALLITVVFIFAINFFMGMTPQNQMGFLNYWLLPCILCINYIVSTLVYYILLKTKKFNA